MRTRTFNSIVELLRDREWHSASEVADRTRYPNEWIDELRREAVLEIDERDGQTLIRLRSDEEALHSALALS